MLLNKLLQGDYTVSSLYHQIKLPLLQDIIDNGAIPDEDNYAVYTLALLPLITIKEYAKDILCYMADEYPIFSTLLDLLI